MESGGCVVPCSSSQPTREGVRIRASHLKHGGRGDTTPTLTHFSSGPQYLQIPPPFSNSPNPSPKGKQQSTRLVLTTLPPPFYSIISASACPFTSGETFTTLTPPTDNPHSFAKASFHPATNIFFSPHSL